MRIEKNNPILHQAMGYAYSLDAFINCINYEMGRTGRFTHIENLYESRIEEIKKTYLNQYIDSKNFSCLNYKYLPFDIATGLNIEMAKYLLDKEINERCNMEIARIKIPLLKYSEDMFKNPNSWQEINRKFGMTPVMPL